MDKFRGTNSNHAIYSVSFWAEWFFGLVFKKWLDFPVFMLVNVAVDMEVLVVNMLGIGWSFQSISESFTAKVYR